MCRERDGESAGSRMEWTFTENCQRPADGSKGWKADVAEDRPRLRIVQTPLFGPTAASAFAVDSVTSLIDHASTMIHSRTGVANG